MTRRNFIATTAPILLRPSSSQPSSPQTAKPKNVLLIMSDQHRPHALGIDGNPFAKTPNLDALARCGVRFDSAYCSNPVCVPARASLPTCLYTHHHGAYNNTTPWPFEHKTIAHHFSRAGYMSALIGKMHFVDAQTHGFDYHLDFNDWFQFLGPRVKLYADEDGYQQVRGMTSIAVAQLARVEVPAALWRKQRIGELSANDARLLTADFEADYYGTGSEPPRFAAVLATGSVLDEAARLCASRLCHSTSFVRRKPNAV